MGILLNKLDHWANQKKNRKPVRPKSPPPLTPPTTAPPRKPPPTPPSRKPKMNNPPESPSIPSVNSSQFKSAVTQKRVSRDDPPALTLVAEREPSHITFTSDTKPASNRKPAAKRPSYRISCGQGLSSYKANVNPFLPPRNRGKLKQDVTTRGTVKYSTVAHIKDVTRRPENSLPKNGLTAWKVLPTDVKIPDIRHRALGTVYYTRGHLGEKLIKNKPEFDLGDPNIHQKTLDTNQYSALHDPNCKSYFMQPTILKHLRNQHLVNEKGEVLCDVKEFNNYREYLGEMFTDRVRHRLEDDNAMKDMERELRRSFYETQRQHDIAERRATNQRRADFNAFYSQSKYNRYLSKIARWNSQLETIEFVKQQFLIESTEASAKRHLNAFQTRQKAEEQDKFKKRRILTRIAYAETKNDYVTKYDKFVRMALIERYKADQAAVLIARDDQNENMEQLVEETVNREKQAWIKKYDGYTQRIRSNPLSHYHAKVLHDARVDYLMRKYWNKWVTFTNNRRRAKPDANHQTQFENLRPFVMELKHAPSRESMEADRDKDKPRLSQKRRSTVADIAYLILQQKASKHHHHHFHHGEEEFHLHKPSTLLTLSSAASAKSLKNTMKQVDKLLGHGPPDDVPENKRTARKPNPRRKLRLQESYVEDKTDYIDKVVARYSLKEQELQKRLRGSNASEGRPRSSRRPTVTPEPKASINIEERQQHFMDKFTYKQSTNPAGRKTQAKEGWKAFHR